MDSSGQNISNQLNNEEESNFLNEVDFEKVLNVLRKSLLPIFIIFLLSVTGAYLYLRYTPPLFQSESILKLNIKKEADALGLIRESADQDLNNLSGEIELLKSNLLVNRVIKTPDLRVSYFAYGKIMDSERYNNSPFKVDYKIYNNSALDKHYDVTILNNEEFELRDFTEEEGVKRTYKFGETIENSNYRFVITLDDDFAENKESSTFYFIIHSDAALEKYISENLQAEVVNMYANTIKVSFQDHNKYKAQDIVAIIDSIYLKLTLEEKNKANKQKISFLDSLLSETEDKLEHFENYFEEFIIKNKTSDIPSDISKTVEKIELLNVEKKKLTTQLSILNNLSNQIIEETDTAIGIPVADSFSDPQLLELIKQLNQVITEKERLAFSYSEKTAAYRLRNTELERLRASIDERIDKNKDFLYGQVQDLNNKISSLEDVFLTLPSKGTAYSKNQRQYKVHESYYLNMMQKKAELGIEEAGTIPEFQVLAHASLPVGSIFPDKLVVYGIAIGLALFLSIVLVVSRYLLYNTINNIKDLEKATAAPILGSIPYYTKEKMVISRLIVDRNPKSAISESLRSIRTNMEFMVPNKKKKIISVTSTVGGEGKTFVAVNMGGVIALSQQKVVLVDLDMRKPKVNLAFGHENLEGMSTILIGKHQIDDCIRKTPLKNLDYISAGPTPPNPSELILSSEFDEVINYLHTIYDVIILDTPPVGLVTDGVLVMRKADLPIYIVRSDYSKREFVKTLNKLIKENKFTKTSVILNSVKYSRNNYYNYGYGNGYYEDVISEPKRFPKISELINTKR